MSNDNFKEQGLIDESSKLSFPASDSPPWVTAPHEAGAYSTGEEITLTEDFKLQVEQTLNIDNNTYNYYSLEAAERCGLKSLSYLPFTLKILLENLLRDYCSENSTVKLTDIKAMIGWLKYANSMHEITFRPARVLMQDFTGVPAVADLAAMRSVFEVLGGDPKRINPLTQVDLVIDHSIQVDQAITPQAFDINAKLEMQRNIERYEFLRWGQQAFENFQVIPPDTGICHQVNLEYLAKVIYVKTCNEKTYIFPDTVVGTDSHTTMVNGLGVLGYGVGGIEAESVMLDQPISMIIPEVVGVNLIGELSSGITATDLVLTITQLLRWKKVVGKFVEFYGGGLKSLTVENRATIANMAPEYGATCGFFPIDELTIEYLRLTNRNQDHINLVEAYAKKQGLWHEPNSKAKYSDTLTIDLSLIEPSMAGPKRPQDKVKLFELPQALDEILNSDIYKSKAREEYATAKGYNLKHGDVVIASITSCTNTSNPNVIIMAGLIAKKAVEKGLERKPWVKTSLAPGSQVVSRYLEELGLQEYLTQIGFSVIGYGCATCIGNSGPLFSEVEEVINENDLVVASVLSGNRNFEGRIHPLVQANFLASPPLVVIFALTGTILIDITSKPIAKDKRGNEFYLEDLWPSDEEVRKYVSQISRKMFLETYKNITAGSGSWQNMKVPKSQTYVWNESSTYIRKPSFFDDMEVMPTKVNDIIGARILAILGDSITTDHISPAGSIKPNSPAGQYLISKNVEPKDFNSYGSRRGNHEVMVRGTFANIRIRNEMVPNVVGGVTRHYSNNEILPIYEVAMQYKQQNTPLIIIAGKEYGTGSSRDWAAKGPKLLGVRAIIAESFERIHRSNLIGMGILPLEFTNNQNRKSLKLIGTEKVDIYGLSENLQPRMKIQAIFCKGDNSQFEVNLLLRIDTQTELNYYIHGGILQYVLRQMLNF